jgi:DNA polymerase-3 subunit delta'
MACTSCPACGWFESANHPDFRLVEPGHETEREEEEQGAAKGSARILIEQIRELADFINVSSHRGGPKVVVIQPAEALNANAANALLKNLEEPPPGTFFLLATHRPHFLLPTIRSRCQQIALAAPEPEAAIAWLRAQGARDPALALAQTGNAPLLAQQLTEREEYWQQRDSFLEHIAVPGFDALAAAEEVCGFAVRDIVGWLQKWTFDLVFQKFLGKVRYNPDRAAAISALAARVDPLTVLRFHREVLRLQRVIDHPLNPRLLIEQLLLDYAGALDTAPRHEAC